MKVIAVAFVVMSTVWWVTALVCSSLVMLSPRQGTVNPGFHPWAYFFSPRTFLGIGVLFTPLYLTGLVVNAPLLVVLRLLRLRLPRAVVRHSAAIGMLVWIQWAAYQMEWFDVWRHGTPDWRYFVTYLIPLGAAFWCAGLVIGRAMSRDRAGRTHSHRISRTLMGATPAVGWAIVSSRLLREALGDR
jgi:hypothetical protein